MLQAHYRCLSDFSEVRSWVNHPGIQLNLALCERYRMQPFNQYILFSACTRYLTCVVAHAKVCRETRKHMHQGAGEAAETRAARDTV